MSSNSIFAEPVVKGLCLVTVWRRSANIMWFRISWLLFIILGGTTNAFADDTARFALVIGNQNYQSASLKHALNDARAISFELMSLGYSVTAVTDADAKTLTQTIKQFYQTVRNFEAQSKLAVFYYAGHAVQINHVNYLIPLSIEFDSENSFVSSLYKVPDMFDHMQDIPGLHNVVILDACRNNPFQGSDSELTAQGLAPVKAPSGTLIAFATEPGGVASDGASANGIYTKHLLKFIGKSLPVEEVFKKVRAGVARETRNGQIPWEHSSLFNEIYFNPPKNKALPDIVVF